jgi:hypothetical protein
MAGGLWTVTVALAGGAAEEFVATALGDSGMLSESELESELVYMSDFDEIERS